MDLTESGGKTLPNLEASIKYHCFLSGPFLFFLSMLEKVVPVYNQNIWRWFILV